MTLLRKMDAALTVLCAALAFWSWRATDAGMLLTWGASAIFCALSFAFSWADKMYRWIKPAFVRVALASAMRRKF